MFNNFPFERQLDAMDCGAVCMKIVSRYYGKYHSLQYLREICSQEKGGVSLQSLSKAADALGFKSLCVRATTLDLQLKVPLPCIIHWDKNHFVVLYKASKRKLYVSDPAKGLLTYTTGEFEQRWYASDNAYGVLMALEPTLEFWKEKGKSSTSGSKLINTFPKYFRPYKSAIGNLVLIMLLISCLQGVLPFISKSIIDVGIQTGDLSFINLVLIANISILIAITLSNITRDWILLHITSRINISLISDYLFKLMKLPISFFEQKRLGDILQRAQDHERIRSFIMNNSLNLIFASLTFLVFGAILMIYNATVFLIFLFGSLSYIAWVLVFLSIRKKIDWEYFDVVSKNQSYWVEMVSSIQDIKVNNYERHARSKWEAIQAELFRINQRLQTISNIQNLGAQFANSLTTILITFTCAKAVLNGTITFGVMISTQFIIGMLSAPIFQLIQFIQSAQFAQISFLRLQEIHQMEDEEPPQLNSNVLLPENKSIFLRNVSFQYTHNGAIVLKGINLSIPHGKITAIVGDSGSGKTTLLKLILRLYKPTFGTISVGKTDIGNISLSRWRSLCGTVLQDGKILNDTVLKNIVFSDDRIDYEQLKKSSEIANILHEIEALPLGYDTVMGELGRGISGGQKQRILIARALYKNPEYLFFDEATNSLDAINEQKIVSALSQVFQGKTVVVIAHRLSTIQMADQIVVLKNGMIEELGNHETLMKRRGYYVQLIESQISKSYVS